MRKVLHVGPCHSPGGMATVIHTLADHPPHGWTASLLSSHAEGGIRKKWKAYRTARKEIDKVCSKNSDRPDVIHLHAAADWSWRRKVRLIRIAQHHDVPCIVHLHSGQFDDWLIDGGQKRQTHVRSVLEEKGVQGVVLSTAWNERLSPLIGSLEVVNIPLPPHEQSDNAVRDEDHLLLLGRADPVKGHAFAVDLVAALRAVFPKLRLTMTGTSNSEHEWVDSLGWVSDKEKSRLVASASVLLIPSAFEGQPMVALEALSAGLPVCASDRVVGLPDTVQAAAYNDVEAWVEVVSGILRHPPEAKLLMASVATYSVDEVQQRWKTIYESL